MTGVRRRLTQDSVASLPGGWPPSTLAWGVVFVAFEKCGSGRRETKYYAEGKAAGTPYYVPGAPSDPGAGEKEEQVR